MPSYAIKSSGIRQVAANRLIGNSTGSTGSAQELSATDAKTLLGLGAADGPTFSKVYLSNIYNSTGAGRIQLGGSDTIFYQGIRMQGAADYLGFDQGGKFYGDGAGTTISQRNGTNAQTFRIYNTDDGTQTDYERGSIGWDSNELKIAFEKGGTGSNRRIRIGSGSYGSIKVNDYLDNTGVAFYQGGVSKFSIRPSNLEPSADNNYGLGTSSRRWSSLYAASATIGNMTLSDLGSYDSITSNDARLALRAQDGSMELYLENASDGHDSFRFNTANGIFELFSDADNQIDLRNGTSPNSLNVFNTWTDASNYERGSIAWDSNTLTIGTAAAGTGVLRAVDFVGSAFDFGNKVVTAGELQLGSTGQCKLDFAGTSLYATGPEGIIFRFESDTTNASIFKFYGNSGDQLTASSGVQSFFDIDADVNQSSTAGYTGIDLDITETATGSGDKNLMDLKVGGTSKFTVDRLGDLTTVGTHIKFGGGSVGRLHAIGDDLELKATGDSDPKIYLRKGSGAFEFSNDNGLFHLYPDADDTLSIRRSTNAQTLDIYATYTDASNYERGVVGWDSNVLVIGTQAAGTGTTREVGFVGSKFNFDPTGSASNIDCDLKMIGKGTATGRLWLQGGTLAPNKIFSTGNVSTATARQLDISVGTSTIGISILTSGGVSMPNLPTSDPASAGELWNDSGTLKVSAG
jgi:hypothetical protein